VKLIFFSDYQGMKNSSNRKYSSSLVAFRRQFNLIGVATVLINTKIVVETMREEYCGVMTREEDDTTTDTAYHISSRVFFG
jgi:hypothetical protein